jgi:hypothetical protein
MNTCRKTVYIHIYMFKLVECDLGEIGWGGVGWIGLVKDRNRWGALVNLVLNLPVP